MWKKQSQNVKLWKVISVSICIYSSSSSSSFNSQRIENEKLSIKEGIKLKIVKGVFVTDIIRLSIFVFHKCCDISFHNFCDKLLAKKKHLKSENHILKISHLTLGMLRAANYLTFDFTFTF